VLPVSLVLEVLEDRKASMVLVVILDPGVQQVILDPRVQEVSPVLEV
jgi:hypothetical protein